MGNENAIVLYVKQTGDSGLLHVGVHDLSDADFFGTDGENLPSSIRYWTADGWSEEISVGMSGTEQYYPIDYIRCPQVDGSYCVTDNRDHGDKLIPGYGELLGLAKIGYFWDPAGCDIHGSFATDTDLLCYHTLANLAFTS